jgi:hypothetical protein
MGANLFFCISPFKNSNLGGKILKFPLEVYIRIPICRHLIPLGYYFINHICSKINSNYTKNAERSAIIGNV